MVRKVPWEESLSTGGGTLCNRESGDWVKLLEGRVGKESGCRLKRTFGKIKWTGWEFRACWFCYLTQLLFVAT